MCVLTYIHEIPAIYLIEQRLGRPCPMIWTSLDRFRDAGLLLMRLGLGTLFITIHGGRKLLGGPERWEAAGEAIQYFGISFLPVMWGFLAGIFELVGGLFLLLGLLFRPATLMILVVMIVAATSQFVEGTGSPYWPVEIGIVMIALFFVGPGAYSLDERFKRRSRVGF